MGYELVWFKRDLRWHDHAALAHAARLGPVRCIYVVEPGLWREPDAALQHFEFVRESLTALDAELKRRGGGLEIHTGECPEVLERIWQAAPFDRLHSHEETGNGYTYARDLRVQAWCKDRGVSWLEQRQFGVVRRLRALVCEHKVRISNLARALKDIGDQVAALEVMTSTRVGPVHSNASSAN